jgi:hypothetical protein
MRLSDRAFRRVMISIWVAFTIWTVGAPIAGAALYSGPRSQPHGAAKVLFYCHL